MFVNFCQEHVQVLDHIFKIFYYIAEGYGTYASNS